ncbi:MAG: OsmC family protein [Chloroflexi bacterium]|nr:OsmC family protein [Chloroflexota bacterium]
MTTITVTGTSNDQYETRITDGRHAFSADEPEPLGTDTGPNPYELLLAALGACTSMTLFMYAGRKSWPLELVEIELSHDREHAEDCERCEEETGLVEVIGRKITLTGPLDAEQRERLAYIATRCPVHKTLSSATTIVDEIT